MADYLYGSARVRALEAAMVGRERMGLLPNEKDVASVWERLREYGIEPLKDGNGTIVREETFLGILRRAYANVYEMLPDDKALELWLYPYDCNNVKAAIKGFAREIDPRSMMFDFGSVDTETVISMVKNGSFEGLPRYMRAAATEAVSTYAKTRNPQAVDLLLDRACYADMLSAASGSAFAVELVKTKIDLTNLLTLIRILRMRSGEAGKQLLHEALIPGGMLEISYLREAFTKGEEALWETLRSTAYDRFAHSLGADSTLTAVERSADNFLMEKLRDVKFVPYGAEVVIAYLLANEYEVRNLRIILAGKEAGLPAATIRERIRESYV